MNRNSETMQRGMMDLCVVVFRTNGGSKPFVGSLIKHSKRQVRGFVGCHSMLEPGTYLAVCLAFNHWNTGEFIFHNFVLLISNVVYFSMKFWSSSFWFFFAVPLILMKNSKKFLTKKCDWKRFFSEFLSDVNARTCFIC